VFTGIQKSWGITINFNDIAVLKFHTRYIRPTHLYVHGKC
jgi:hypothetical protein